MGPSQSVGGSFENIFSTCKDYKYVAITTTFNYPAALCFTQYTGTPVTSCPGSIFQIYGHTPGPTISGYSRKKRQIEEEERQMQQDAEFMEWEALDEQLGFEQNEPVAEVSIEEIEAQFRVMSAQASCPVGLTACAVPSLDGTDSGFEVRLPITQTVPRNDTTHTSRSPPKSFTDWYSALKSRRNWVGPPQHVVDARLTMEETSSMARTDRIQCIDTTTELGERLVRRKSVKKGAEGPQSHVGVVSSVFIEEQMSTPHPTVQSQSHHGPVCD